MLLKNIYYKPTSRHTSKKDMVDLVIPAPGNGTYSVASYIRREYADEIIAALELYSAQHGVEPTIERADPISREWDTPEEDEAWANL